MELQTRFETSRVLGGIVETRIATTKDTLYLVYHNGIQVAVEQTLGEAVASYNNGYKDTPSPITISGCDP